MISPIQTIICADFSCSQDSQFNSELRSSARVLTVSSMVFPKHQATLMVLSSEWGMIHNNI